MASDQQVDARIILQAIAELKRRGINRAMEELEAREPELAGHIMEEISLIYQRLLQLGGTAKASQRLLRQIEAVILIAITALRKAHYELWRKDVKDTPLSRLDEENPPPPPPSAPP